MLELVLVLNAVLLTVAALFIIRCRKVYYRALKRLELKENACEKYLQLVKKEVAKVSNIQSDVTELKNVTLSNQFKRK